MRYGNNLTKQSLKLLEVFGLAKKKTFYGNNDAPSGHFPYGVEQDTLRDNFAVLLGSYEDYVGFTEKYKNLIKSIEDDIIYLRYKLARLTYYGDPNFERADIQSTAAHLGNVATKLYYLRTNARAWRRDINEARKVA